MHGHLYGHRYTLCGIHLNSIAYSGKKYARLCRVAMGNVHTFKKGGCRKCVQSEAFAEFEFASAIGGKVD